MSDTEKLRAAIADLPDLVYEMPYRATVTLVEYNPETKVITTHLLVQPYTDYIELTVDFTQPPEGGT